MACDGDHEKTLVESSVSDVDGRDLEVIVNLLETASVILSPKRGTAFSEGELLEKVKELAGETEVFDVDLRIVLHNTKTLRKTHSGRYVLKTQG